MFAGTVRTKVRMKGLHMLTKVLRPIRTELSTMDCTGLGEVLGLDKKELSSRLDGGTEFTLPELMSVAHWLGRPSAVFFAQFEGFVSGNDEVEE